MLTPQDAVERALSLSTADECIVIAGAGHSANVRWANNTLTTNGVVHSADLTVISIVRDGDTVRAASLSRTGVSADEIGDLVAASAAAAAESPPAADAAPLIERPAAADWDAAPGETSVPELGRVAELLSAAFEQARGRDEGRYGYAEHTVSTTYLGSSTGLRLRDQQGDGRLEMTGRSADGSRSAWAGLGSADIRGLDVEQLERDIQRRLDWSRRKVELDAGRYETILPPSAVADMMIDAYWSMSALDAHEGSTVYSKAGGGTRVGESLTDLPLTLSSDPNLPGQACTPFVSAAASSRLSSVFDNGLELSPTAWISEGRLNALLQTRHSAALTGLPVTPWIDNLALDAPTTHDDIDAIVAATERGLLLTGLTRDGVFLVEDGEVVGAATNFRFNESPIGMMRRITAVGSPQNTFAREFGDYFTRTRMPALRIADFNMSSVSQAS